MVRYGALAQSANGKCVEGGVVGLASPPGTARTWLEQYQPSGRGRSLRDDARGSRLDDVDTGCDVAGQSWLGAGHGARLPEGSDGCRPARRLSLRGRAYRGPARTVRGRSYPA